MYNKVILIGRLTATPEMVKLLAIGLLHVLQLRLIVAIRRKMVIVRLTFITVVVWGRLAETLVSYASKGSLISLDGELLHP